MKRTRSPNSPHRAGVTKRPSKNLSSGANLDTLTSDVYPLLFSRLPKASLLSLSQTSRTIHSAIVDYLGYREAIISPPAVDYQGGAPPPSCTAQGSAVLGHLLFVPVLDAEPLVYVFDTRTNSWSCYPITLDPNPPTTADSEPTTLPPFFPLSTCVAASSSQNCLYLFGGLRRTSSTSETAEQEMPVDPVLVLDPAKSHPSPSVTAPSSLISTDSSQFPTSTFSPQSTASSGLHSAYGPSGRGLRLSSTLYRLDIPAFVFDAALDARGQEWRMWDLGDRNKRAEPLPPLVNQANANDNQGAAESSDLLFEMHLADPLASSASTSGSSTLRSTTPRPAIVPQRDLWPSARRDHTLDVVGGEWLIIFGGQGVSGEGENDVWAWDIAHGGWVRACEQEAGESTTSENEGSDRGRSARSGCMTDTPLIIFDNLTRLSCRGPPSKWEWTLYASPALYDLQHPPETQTESLTPVVFSTQQVLSSETNHDTHPAQTVSASQQSHRSGTASSSHSRRESSMSGVTTTGDIPMERFGCALVVLGPRKLAVIGGLTVQEGTERATGTIYDEFCASHISAIDIFDLSLLHWSAIRPKTFPDPVQLPDFLKETAAIAIPPNQDSRFYSVLIVGRKLDLTGYTVEDVSVDEGEVTDLSGALWPGNGYAAGGGSLRQEAIKLTRADDGEAVWLPDRGETDVHSGDKSEKRGATVRFCMLLLFLLIERDQDTDDMSSDERAGATCLASTFSHRSITEQAQPPLAVTMQMAPAREYQYPDGVFSENLAIQGAEGETKKEMLATMSGRELKAIETMDVVRMIRFTS
ncbi:hypothetical protein P7C73_g3302, partial [Tremellales sp. Uapishka_1]